MTKVPKKEEQKEEIELHSDAWERFEKAVDKISKSGPQPKLKKPQTHSPKKAGETT
jgi:hypothetical protein